MKEGEDLLQVLLDPQATPFNLDYTLDCGQVFRWEKRDDYWTGFVEETVIKLKQNRDGLFFKTFPDERRTDFIMKYFRLDDDLPKIVSEIDKDLAIRRAIEAFHGLRIVRQEPWECLISYICATFSNIARIKKMIRNLSQRFGRKISSEGLTFYAFPSEEALSKATLKDLYDCGLGFRAKYVQAASRMISASTLNLDGLRRLTYGEAKRQLLAIPGVGPKVADCILLFSLDKLEAFPVDVWVRRVISKYYVQHFSDRKLSTGGGLGRGSYEQISGFGRSYFGEYAGYAQEYLFHYYRLHNTLVKEENSMSNANTLKGEWL